MPQDDKLLILVFAGFSLALFVGATFYLMRRLASITRQLAEEKIKLQQAEVELASLSNLQESLKEVKNLEAKKNSELIEAKQNESAAYTQVELLKKQLAEAKSETASLQQDAAKAKDEKALAITELEKMRVTLTESERRMSDWETNQKKSIEAATAAIMEGGAKLSNKLLEDHKRETEAAKKESEQKIQENTNKLFEQFQTVIKNVHSLDEQVQKHGKQSDIVWRALTSPQSAGYFGEIGLENTLISFGLLEGRDFRLQFSITTSEGRFRPDALVFLPSNAVLVIDSKATQAVLELAAAEQNGTDVQAALTRLKEAMNNQLKNLVSKEYDKVVAEYYREKGRIEEVAEIVKVMYVPSEAAFSHIAKADPDFMQKAVSNKIILAGPQSLAGLIALAKIKIQELQQIENYKTIMDSIRDFLGRLAVALDSVDGVGKSIQKAGESYSKFARSVNTRLLPKVREMEKMGLKHSAKKDFPAKLPEFESATGRIIDGEAEEVENIAALENSSKEAA